MVNQTEIFKIYHDLLSVDLNLKLVGVGQQFVKMLYDKIFV